MDITQENLLMLSEYLSRTLSPDVSIRRPAEQYLEMREGESNYVLLLLNIINKNDMDMTVRVTAAIAFKNHIKKHWIVDEDDGVDRISKNDREAVKNLIVDLMLSSPEAIQKQLSDAVTNISKHDFPDKWPSLLDQLIAKMKTGDFNIIIGVLHTAHSLFKKYRIESKSQKLWVEIKLVLGSFCQPFMELFMYTMNLTASESNPATLKVLYDAVLLMCKVYHSLNSQDLPEFFEDSMKLWMEHFRNLLKANVPCLMISDDAEEPGVLEQLKSEICDVVSLYAHQYDEEFTSYLPGFAEDIWNLLTSLQPSQKNEILICKALHFLSTVASRARYQELFKEDAVLSSICEKVIIPNIEFRDVDQEMFEENPEEYIRRDIEGSDVDTHRRSACELVKVFCECFEEKIVAIFGSYVQAMLDQYNKDTSAWRSKDAALYLVTTLAERGRTEKYGVTQTSKIVNLDEFTMNHIINELNQQRVNTLPVIKADCLKYAMTFRSVLPMQTVFMLFPHVIKHLEANSIVQHTYAAVAIDKILCVKTEPNGKIPVINNNVIEPYAEDLLRKLFGVLSKSGSTENEHAMKAIVRSLATLDQAAIPYLAQILPNLTTKLAEVSKNPTKPNFNHFLFECLAISIKIVCKSSPEAVLVFEQQLFPIFQTILQQDVVEFVPYVFQLLAMLLERHRDGDISDPYWALYPCLLSPSLWERTGNIHPLIRLINAYVAKCNPDEIKEKLNLNSLLGIYQRLISNRLHDHDGFSLIQTLLKFCPRHAMEPYMRPVFILVFQRLSISKTKKLIHGVIMFFSHYIIHFGGEVFVSLVENIQKGLLRMVVENLIIKDNNLQCITDKIERRHVTIGMAQLLCGSKTFTIGQYSGPMWNSLMTSVVNYMESQSDRNDEVNYLDENVFGAYDTAYSRLVFASKIQEEPYPNLPDSKKYLASQIKAIMPTMGQVLANHPMNQTQLMFMNKYVV